MFLGCPALAIPFRRWRVTKEVRFVCDRGGGGARPATARVTVRAMLHALLRVCTGTLQLEGKAFEAFPADAHLVLS